MVVRRLEVGCPIDQSPASMRPACSVAVYPAALSLESVMAAQPAAAAYLAGQWVGWELAAAAPWAAGRSVGRLPGWHGRVRSAGPGVAECRPAVRAYAVAAHRECDCPAGQIPAPESAAAGHRVGDW